MFTEEGFESFIDEIAKANGLDRETAGDYAVQIGDTPVVDENGRVLVRNKEGETVALKLP